jgi:hypothetical protein
MLQINHTLINFKPFTKPRRTVMKKLIYLILLTAVMTFVGCQKQESTENQITVEEKQQVEAVGQAAAAKLMVTLKGELTKAMQVGVSDAIEVCSNKALELTNSITDSVENVTAIKRTTFKYRNPQNAPDEWEMKALKMFEEAAQKGEALPASYVQKVEENGQTSYRYYQPMKVAPLCLNCHGDKNMLSEEVSAQLANLYPEDKATGYQEGDFRGVIRVSVALGD